MSWPSSQTHPNSRSSGLRRHRRPEATLLSRAFIITLLTTQFIFIEVGGGALRPYHFLEVFLLALMAPRIMGLWKSNIFRAVLALNAASIFCALFSPDPNAALTSYVLFALNSSIAIAIAGIIFANTTAY